MILRLAAILLVSFVFSPLRGQNKNILHIRFQTATLTKGYVDSIGSVVLNVTYKLIAPKPVNFTGFECRYSYDATKIRPTTVFFDGTACANADIKGANNDIANGEYRVEVLSSNSLDLTNPILFQVWYNVRPGFTDSAMIAPTRFDVLSSTSGIDTVIIDNAPGRDQISWFPFGLIYIDTATHTPPPQKKVTITISSDSATMKSDSMKVISVLTSKLDSAHIKNAAFEFDVDTLAFDSVAVTKGSLLANMAFGLSINLPHVTVTFSPTDTSKTLQGQGELLRIALRGKKIADTICTGIRNPKFTAFNADELLASVIYKLHGICVLGIAKKDTVTKGIVQPDENNRTKIYPNPASSFIDFILPQSGKKRIEVFDALGMGMLDEIADANFRWNVARVPAGLYSIRISELEGIGKTIEKTKILIIH